MRIYQFLVKVAVPAAAVAALLGHAKGLNPLGFSRGA
jgi:hypothetical protein